MSKREEQEIFLDYIRDIYLCNPNLQINEDTIYKELTVFYVKNNIRKRIGGNSLLLNVQQQLSRKFGANFGRNGYFWLYENRNNVSDREFYNKLYDGIKLYVSVDAENLCEVTTKIVEYMAKEHIITQSKVAKEMRNDVLVIRVSTKEEATKIINYINSLNYKSKVKPNPFTLSNGKVNITRDGTLSYNTTLCKLIENYLIDCKTNNNLENASIEGLSTYTTRTINKLKGPYKKELIELYQINSEREYIDVLMVLNLISKNLNGTITLEDVLEDNKIKNISEETSNKKEDKDKFKYALSGLSKYYNTSEIHEIMTKYIQTGDLSYFTRRDNIRQVMSSFTPQKLDNIIEEMGTSALIDAVIETRKKYPNINQAEHAIKLLILKGDLSGFTNNNNSRSYLGLVAPTNKLIDILIKKLNINEQSALYSILNLDEKDYRALILFLEKSPNIRDIDSDTLAKVDNNLMLLDNIAFAITNNIYQEIDRSRNTKNINR